MCIKRILFISLFFTFLSSSLLFGNGKLTIKDQAPYPKPWIKVPNEHPRLLMRSSDFGALEKNMESEEMRNAVKEHQKLLENTFDGVLPKKKAGEANFDGRLLAVIESRAFEYVLFKNKAEGVKAISTMRNVLNTIIFDGISDISRPIGQTIFTASQVYDWCYDLLTKDDKLFIIEKCEELAGRMEIEWPPIEQGAVTSHAGEAQLMRDLFSFSIAVYDERPEFYDWTMGRYLHEFIKPREFWYQSFTHHQGSAYGAYRQIWDAWALWIIYRMSGEKVLSPNLAQATRNLIYIRRPDGQLFREGDYTFENIERKLFWGKNDERSLNRKQDHVGTVTLLVGNFFRDPVLKNEALFYNPRFKDFNYTNATRTPVQFMLFNDPTVAMYSNNTLPLARFNPPPYGGIVARSGWDNSLTSNDVIAFMKIGELTGANHNHLDAGNFQIFYKGILASESGYYRGYNSPHHLNYLRATIAHNCLLIKDPDEVFGMTNRPPLANDGGQNQIHSEAVNYEQWISGPYDRGKVLAHQISTNRKKTDYAYIKGDLTKAYTHRVNKVSEVLRSMLFVPTNNKDFPAMFVVFDKVVSTNPAFKKTFLLHSQEEPEIHGKTSIIKRIKYGYNGMLVNQTLLPIDAEVTMIGGTGSSESSNRFVADGVNYIPNHFHTYDEETQEGEFGWGRIEISPGKDSLEDYFLNVMYVKDADKDLPIQQADLIETEQIAGVKQLGHALLFAKDATKLQDEITFTITGNEKNLNVIIAGVAEGKWNVEVNGVKLRRSVDSTAEGGLLYFIAPAGQYRLKK